MNTFHSTTLCLSLSFTLSLSPFSCLPFFFPQLRCSFQIRSSKEVHHRGWLITSPDICILAILFGNREIKEFRDTCCQASTLERPEMHLSVPKWLLWCIKPFRNLPACNYSRGLCPLLHTRINSNWPQCVYVFVHVEVEGDCHWQLILPLGLCFIMTA